MRVTSKDAGEQLSRSGVPKSSTGKGITSNSIAIQELDIVRTLGRSDLSPKLGNQEGQRRRFVSGILLSDLSTL